MMKKIFAVALAAAMTITSAVSAFAAPITLEGFGWWNASNQASENMEIADNTTKTYSVKCTAGDAAGYAAFITEIRDNTEGATHCITTASDGNGWYFADGGTTGDAPTGLVDPLGSVIVADVEYEVSVTRAGADIAVKYYDKTNDKVFADMQFKNTNIAGTVTVNFAAQAGTFEIEEVVVEDSAEDETTTGTPEAGETATTAKPAPNTGDATTTAGIAVVAFAAAAAVVVLRKRAINE